MTDGLLFVWLRSVLVSGAFGKPPRAFQASGPESLGKSSPPFRFLQNNLSGSLSRSIAPRQMTFGCPAKQTLGGLLMSREASRSR